VRQDLQAGKQVLFCGTPCQVAGLKAWLGKQQDNLFTMDLICHGVPSQKLWKKALASDEKKQKSPITAYEFRNKEKRGWDTNFKKTFRNGKTVYGSGKLDVFYKAFLAGEIYRECCYTCRYANMNRVGDLTVGDFWGIDKELPAFDSRQGASCVIVNSEKGETLFSAIRDDLILEPVSLEQILRHNHNLVSPTCRPAKRNAMYLNLDQLPFEEMDISRRHEPRLKDWVSYRIPGDLKGKLKKLLRRS
jgi:coenzyme F420-reducing hydrogenase beta subunit